MLKVYFDAARLVEKCIVERRGLKSCLYEQGDCKPQLLALASRTLQNVQLLRRALSSVGLFPAVGPHEDKPTTEGHHRHADGSDKGRSKTASHSNTAAALHNKYLVLVMAYELLLGKGLRVGGVISRMLKQNRHELQHFINTQTLTTAVIADASLTAAVNGNTCSSTSNFPVGSTDGRCTPTSDHSSAPYAAASCGNNTITLSSWQIPRYARVATYRASQHGYTPADIAAHLERDLAVSVAVDPLVPNLLVLPAKASAAVVTHQFVKNGIVVLQG
eukprot:Lankesteria_metandrocarpae@DN1583_c0_g1_i3.p1